MSELRGFVIELRGFVIEFRGFVIELGVLCSDNRLLNLK